jgi:hypothetical protein
LITPFSSKSSGLRYSKNWLLAKSRSGFIEDTQVADFSSEIQAKPQQSVSCRDQGDWVMHFNSTESILNSASTLLDFSSVSLGDAHSGCGDEAPKVVDTRRVFMAGALFAAGIAAGAGNDDTIAYASELKYESSPVNKRLGVTVFDAENAGYNIQFVTYLSRFLLNFDGNCQRWWYARAGDIPRDANAEKVASLRLKQFGAFSASVEVGLQEYEEKNGPARLMSSLLDRYCPDGEKLAPMRLPGMSASEMQRQEREIDEARRQIALLFGLLEEFQPVGEITKVLAAVDNATVYSVELVDGGAGYAPGYGPPNVLFPVPEAGEDFDIASGRAVLTPSGRILRIDLPNRGFGYTKPPDVTISPPAGSSDPTINKEVGVKYETATAKAFLFKEGVNKGRILRVTLTTQGAGYNENEKIRVKISPPQLKAEEGGVTAIAKSVREYKVGAIDIIEGGSGYAAEKAIPIYIEPPPLTARIDLTDQVLVGSFKDDKKSKTQQQLTPEAMAIASFKAASKAETAAKGAGEGGAGGCVGRDCYDQKVVAYAYARAEKQDSYTSVRDEEVAKKMRKVELAVEGRSVTSDIGPALRGSSSASGDAGDTFALWQGGSSASLLALLPSGVGLQFDNDLQRYKLAARNGVKEKLLNQSASTSSVRLIDPFFGPRGRSPIERQKTLDLNTFGRFALSGAICASAAHLVLTPLDVVKTKVQTDPENYPDPISAFKKLFGEGPSAFFAGWVPTLFGYFTYGAVAYSVTEFFRRYFSSLAGDNAGSLEVPIILASATVAGICASLVLSPSEAVRIRSVYDPTYADSMGGVISRMVKVRMTLTYLQIK